MLEWIKTIADIGTFFGGIGTLLGAGFVAYVSFKGYGNWKKQKRHELHITRAQNILDATYKVKRALSHVRNPIFWFGEMDDAKELLKGKSSWNEVGDEEKKENMEHRMLYLNRLDREQDAWRALEACEVMTLFFKEKALGESVNKLIDQFLVVKKSACDLYVPTRKERQDQIVDILIAGDHRKEWNDAGPWDERKPEEQSGPWDDNGLWVNNEPGNKRRPGNGYDDFLHSLIKDIEKICVPVLEHEIKTQNKSTARWWRQSPKEPVQQQQQ